MALALGALSLPAGLVWEDEFAWSPVAQSAEYGLTGALVLDVASKQAGRPITLTGQSDSTRHTGWVSRADLLALTAALGVPGATFALTLHDARTFTVVALHDGEGPIDAEPLPTVGAIRPADPASTRWYLLKKLRLITV